MIENDLNYLKVGDNVFHARYGKSEVTDLKHGRIFIDTGAGYSYYECTGKIFQEEQHPSLFKSLDHLIKYFTEVKNSEANKQGEISEKEN